MYVCAAAPYNFNGLVRHYFLRQDPFHASIQVNLSPPDHRDLQSHDLAKKVRPGVQAIAERFGASVKVAEVPPGPPVLQTLVAEIYGPDYQRQLELSDQIEALFRETEGVVDIDSYTEEPQKGYRFQIDREKAALSGVSVEQVVSVLNLSIEGVQAGIVHDPLEKEDVNIVLRLPREGRATVEDLEKIRVIGSYGKSVVLGELVEIRETTREQSIYHKNLMPVVYVTGDLAGAAESPVYTIGQLQKKVSELKIPEQYEISQFTASQPFDSQNLSIKWDGEWYITYEVFRDMGLAFACVLVLIYLLVVGWFQSLVVPLVIMAAIPFSLVGILPAHWGMGAFFTATSMIGFIAGAGIVVRNSIILVDFIILRLEQGMPLAEAVVDAGAVRFRPMMLTAAAVVVGASVILFDPIFQGLAIALMAGEIASLFLSRLTVPILFYMVGKKSGGANLCMLDNKKDN
ncbi:MAG: efflux RND transporter permease subunit, partial [Anaerolineales bacterium]|nr:efflux RND transporter permease subunit [Anaerolineales bacterium]